MSSDRRLHPISILFRLAAHVRALLVPGLVVLVTAGSTGWGDWQVWAMLLVVPYALVSTAQYFSFRYRYEPSEMVVRTGLIFRNERHVPYARIQNLDAVQNLAHRLFGVMEVRVQTGAGAEPEATMRVLPAAAFEEMRQRVFGGGGGAGAPDEDASLAAPAGDVLLRLPPRELMLFGVIQSRGLVAIAAGFGVIWELGLFDRAMSWIQPDSGRGIARQIVRAWFGRGGLPLGRIALMIAAFAALLLILRLLSAGLALVRLHGFTLTRIGEDLRTECGLLTRVVATIPLRRVQTLTIREGPLHRLFGRVSVRVETAGGSGADATAAQREWLAPIVSRAGLPALVQTVQPGLDLSAVVWRPAHPRAFRRAVKMPVAVSLAVALWLVPLLWWWDAIVLAALLAWSVAAARGYVARLGWSVTDDAVLFRSGWLWRQVSVARFNRIQAVALHESPFDRRARMARVRVDTAGAGAASHRVDVRYLPRQTADDLYGRLATEAARTTFRW
jgi:putative membrane protein